MALSPDEPILGVRDLEKRIGARTLFAGVDLGLSAQDRVGLVGLNGAGKSTLLRVLVGDAAGTPEPVDGGTVTRRRDLRLVYVPQEPTLPAGRRVREVLESAHAEHSRVLERLTALEGRMATLDGPALEAALEEQVKLHERLEALGGWDLAHRIREVASALGVPPGDRDVDTLSIGERRRVALACAFLAGPDLLALDEPTNHLDATTTDWLEDKLLAMPGALLLVTHDRYFLDRVATRILELDRGRVHSYEGGYGRYLEQRAERLHAESEQEAQRAAFVRRELVWIRAGTPARSTKQKARIQRFEAAASNVPTDLRPDQRSIALQIPPGPRLGGTVLELHGLTKSLGGKTLFRGLDLVMKPGDRIGIVGPNGVGKTTLIRTILGQIEPDAGSVKMGQNTKPLFLDQTRSDLRDEQTVIEAVAAENDQVWLPDGPVHVRTFLRMMLLDDRLAGARVGQLSGGERNRVQLTRLLREGGNLLILDEPTNDLDLMTLSALEEGLTGFPGCALVVSHDRWFLDRVATGILAFEGDGRVVFYEGNYTEWVERRPKAGTEPAPAPVKRAPSDTPKPAKLTYAEKIELEGIEPAIEAAEARVAEVEAALADPDLYKSRGAEVPGLNAALAAARAEVERLYARWGALSEKA